MLYFLRPLVSPGLSRQSLVPGTGWVRDRVRARDRDRVRVRVGVGVRV